MAVAWELATIFAGASCDSPGLRSSESLSPLFPNTASPSTTLWTEAGVGSPWERGLFGTPGYSKGVSKPFNPKQP